MSLEVAAGILLIVVPVLLAWSAWLIALGIGLLI